MNFLPLGVVLVLIFLVMMIFVSIKAPNRTPVVLTSALGVGVVFRGLDALYGTSGAFYSLLSAIAGVIFCLASALAASWLSEEVFSVRDAANVAVIGFFLGVYFGLAVLFLHAAGLLLIHYAQKRDLFNIKKFSGYTGDLSLVLVVLVVSLFPSVRSNQVLVPLGPIFLAMIIGMVGFGRFAKARKLMEANNYDRAVEILQKLAKGKPKDPEVNCELGHALLLAGQSEAALPFLDRAIALQPGSSAQLYKGLALTELKQYSEAVQTLQNSLTFQPNDVSVIVAAANAYYYAGNLSAALNLYNRVLELRPEWYEILTTRAAILFDLGMYAESINDYTALIKHQGESYESLMNIAKGYELLKDKSGMEQAYRKVIDHLQSQLSRHPNSGPLLGQMGLVHMKLGEWAKALELFDRATVIDPTDYQALSNKSVVLCELKRYDLALGFAEKAVKLAPTYTHWVNMGNALRGLNKPTEALAAFDQALDLHPDSSQGLWGRALVLFDLGDFVRSLDCFGKYMQIAGDNAQGYLFIGRCLMGLKKYPEALQAFEHCIGLESQNAAGWYYKGTVYLIQGELKLAGDCLKKAVEFNPQNLAAYYNLSRIQAMQGLTADALANLTRVIKNDRRYLEVAAKDGSLQNLRSLKEFNDILDVHQEQAL